MTHSVQSSRYPQTHPAETALSIESICLLFPNVLKYYEAWMCAYRKVTLVSDKRIYDLWPVQSHLTWFTIEVNSNKFKTKLVNHLEFTIKLKIMVYKLCRVRPIYSHNWLTKKVYERGQLCQINNQNGIP